MEKFFHFSIAAIVFLCILDVQATEEDVSSIVYDSPSIVSDRIFFSEHFDNLSDYKKNWVLSKAKKGQADGTVANYDGIWEVEQAVNSPLPGDFGLVLKSKAKHAAISSRLIRKFDFTSGTLVVQFEVTFQDGQECGGAYVKLLSDDGSVMDLAKFHDLTPYTIMFGPDKCGNDNKLHFIFRHKNPRNGSYEEKHAKKPSAKLDEFFTNMKPHLYTLILKQDNTFKVLVDQNLVNEGSLLTDMTPPVNPPSEIDDPLDKEPSDWDNREKIPDPTAMKPDDWDENAPATIPDMSAVMPEGWLEEEPTDIKDPAAEKPVDWDVEMDGEWEAPLIPNPVCQDAPGCGPWTPPQIANPNYKGKWYPPLIENPSFKGKWTPKKIPNPDYFEDNHPFRMTPIVAVGFELWSMSANILFDNLIITDSEEHANDWATQTFGLKKSYLEKSGDSMITKFFQYTNQNPWLYAVYVILLLIPTVFAVLFCFGTTVKDKDEAAELVRKKKFDETTADDEAGTSGTTTATATAVAEQLAEPNSEEQAEDDSKPVSEVEESEEEGDPEQEEDGDEVPDTQLEPEAEEVASSQSEKAPPRRRVRAD